MVLRLFESARSTLVGIVAHASAYHHINNGHCPLDDLSTRSKNQKATPESESLTNRFSFMNAALPEDRSLEIGYQRGGLKHDHFNKKPDSPYELSGC
ncbi:hypothetical protein H6F76_17080 [Leptolyngbya sp. FACHB-321]|nr:hypothetical protein [Leptolyngbya sp. FACHB-321]